MAESILLIDTDRSHAGALQMYLSKRYSEVQAAHTAEQLNDLLAEAVFDVLLGNPYSFGEQTVLQLKALKKDNALLQIILACPQELMDQAMDDFGSSAISYLATPVNSKALSLALATAEKNISIEKKLATYSERLSDLHTTQSLYHQLFNEVPCYITVQNRGLRLTDANAKFKKDFGREVGGFCYEIYKHRNSPCPVCPVSKTFSDGRSHGTEEVVTSKDGRQYNVITQTAPIRDENGEITQVIEMSTNITQIRQLQDHLSSLGLMLGSMSHGIKGMLTGLDGSLYQLETGMHAHDQQKTAGALQQIRDISERIKKMVLDILAYAKSRELQYRTVDVKKLAQRVLSIADNQAGKHNIPVKCTFDEPLGSFEVDENWIQSALVNFLENAIDACTFDTAQKEHYVALRVRAQSGDKLCFSIEDNGLGMNRKTRESLFTLFYSSKGAQGTGLGLFIADQVVKQHGGHIQVSSRPSRGTRFEVCLPRKKPEPQTLNCRLHSFRNLSL